MLRGDKSGKTTGCRFSELSILAASLCRHGMTLFPPRRGLNEQAKECVESTDPFKTKELSPSLLE